MLRKSLISAIHEENRAVEASSIFSALRSSNAGSDKKTDPPSILRAFRAYSIEASQYSSEAKRIAKIFDLEKLENPDFWFQMIASEAPNERMQAIRSIGVLKSELPKILEALTQDQPEVVDALEGKRRGNEELISSVTIQLVEEDGRFSTVQRLVDALSACEEIYSALANLLGQQGVPLAVGSIDSGSDKSFDLFGAAALMKEFRELIVSLWGLVVFHRETKLGKQLELVAASLPILERISDLESQQKLGREQALIIRNGILDGSKKFLDSGVITEDLKNHSTYDPRKLLAPEPKLLAAPADYRTTSDGGEAEANPPETQRGRGADGTVGGVHNLTDEELDRLADRIAKRSTKSEDEDESQ